MHNTWIGVVGASGEIGSAAVEYLLKRGKKVIGGQRRAESAFQDNPDFRLHRMDLYKDEELQKFCNSCGVVMNCAGPSYKIRGRVAKCAGKAHTVYIDLSDIIIKELQIQESLPKNEVYIVGTGYLPGISGILFNAICSGYRKIDKFQGFQAGRQYYTKIAFQDILISSISNSGYPDAFLKKGAVGRSLYACDGKIDIPGIPEPVCLKPYIPYEILDAARQTDKITELHWFNALTDKKMMNMMMKAYAAYAASDEEGSKMAEKMYDDFFSHMENRPNWSELLYEVTGVKNQQRSRERFILNLKDSNRFCGLIGAKTAIKMLEDVPEPGIYWCKDLMRYSSIEEWRKDFPETDLEVLNIPADSAPLIAGEIESDYL